MNIQQYIRSGIIESYALGLASVQERAEFECMLPLYSELQSALSAFELQLELFAIRNEAHPPPGTLEKIEDRLR